MKKENRKNKFNYSFATAKGLRDHNEDAGFVGVNATDQCFGIVCDGIGSQSDSQIASAMIVDYFKNKFKKRNHIVNPSIWISRNIVNARKKLAAYCKAKLNNKKITTTFVCVFIQKDGRAICFNLGDSRLYRFDITNFKWRQITKDHNLYNYLVSSNAPQEMFVKYKDSFLALTKYVDSNTNCPLDYDKFSFKLNPGDLIFLGSDGVYNYIDMPYIDDYINKNRDKPFYATSTALIRKALENHSNDNLTSIVIEIL